MHNKFVEPLFGVVWKFVEWSATSGLVILKLGQMPSTIPILVIYSSRVESRDKLLTLVGVFIRSTDLPVRGYAIHALDD
ncbi:hypothetical protein TNCV_2264551 [Trichonephila clavipes]|nr:hypothetical protein TNCV_2264551 [Trichonephila clavipes]